MPKRGQPMPEQQQIRHRAAMASPLRAITGAVQTGTFADGSPIYAEQLACGHVGRWTTSPEQAQAFAARGIRRRCQGCREATPPTPEGRCTCCGRPCRPEDAPLCLACTLLAAEETDESERWNYPEQHHER